MNPTGKRTSVGKVIDFFSGRKKPESEPEYQSVVQLTPGTPLPDAPLPSTLEASHDVIKKLWDDADTLRQQRDQLEAKMVDFDRLNNTLIEVALCFREHYAAEIEAGQHAGRSDGAIITGYLLALRRFQPSFVVAPVPSSVLIIKKPRPRPITIRKGNKTK